MISAANIILNSIDTYEKTMMNGQKVRQQVLFARLQDQTAAVLASSCPGTGSR